MSGSDSTALGALARAALVGVAPDGTVGEQVSDVLPEESVHELAFASRLPGYVDWRWTVAVATLPDSDPSVLEVELLPGEGSLVAPPWVPWADRLAEYRRTHPDEDVAESADELDADELDEDEDESDEADDDEDDLDTDDGDVLDVDDLELELESDDGIEEPDELDGADIEAESRD